MCVLSSIFYFYLELDISKYIFHDEVSCSAMTHSFVEIFCRCIFVASFCISGLHSFWFWVEVTFNSSAFFHFTASIQSDSLLLRKVRCPVLSEESNLYQPLMRCY